MSSIPRGVGTTLNSKALIKNPEWFSSKRHTPEWVCLANSWPTFPFQQSVKTETILQRAWLRPNFWSRWFQIRLEIGT